MGRATFAVIMDRRQPKKQHAGIPKRYLIVSNRKIQQCGIHKNVSMISAAHVACTSCGPLEAPGGGRHRSARFAEKIYSDIAKDET